MLLTSSFDYIRDYCPPQTKLLFPHQTRATIIMTLINENNQLNYNIIIINN